MPTLRSGLSASERSTVLGHEWFSGLSYPAQQEILASASVRRYEHGEPVTLFGGKAQHWIGCASGSVRVSALSIDAREFTLAYIPAGVWFGDPGLFDGQHLLHDTFAHGPTTLLLLARDKFEVLLAEDLGFSAAVLASQARLTRLLYRFVEVANTTTVESRLAWQLVALTRSHGAVEGAATRIDLALRQAELARLIGASRQRVNLHLKQFERAGLIELRLGLIRVFDIGGLSRLASQTAGRVPWPRQCLRPAVQPAVVDGFALARVWGAAPRL